MKQRSHRKIVQRRMREAPTQYDRDCQFYGRVAWTKREREAIAKGKPVPLMFNRIHTIGPDTFTHRTIGPSGTPGHVTVTDYHSLRSPAVLDSVGDAMDNALKTGEGWALVGGSG